MIYKRTKPFFICALVVATLLLAAGCGGTREQGEAVGTVDMGYEVQADDDISGMTVSARKEPKIVKYGWRQDPGESFVNLVAIVSNPNERLALSSLQVVFTGKDEKGTILFTESVYAYSGLIGPKEEMAVSAMQLNKSGSLEKVTCEVKKTEDWEWSVVNDDYQSSSDTIDVKNLSIDVDSYGLFRTISGKVTNTSKTDYESVHLTFIFKDKKGNLVGGTSASVNELPGKETAAFDTTMNAQLEYDSYDYYVSAREAKSD